MQQPTHTHDTGPRPVVLTELEARLSIPDDVLVVEQDPNQLPTWFTGVSSISRRVILLNAGLAEYERAFTLAHEFAHILLGHDADTAPNEAAADELAATLLAEAAR